jgi:hypothetical protein
LSHFMLPPQLTEALVAISASSGFGICSVLPPEGSPWPFVSCNQLSPPLPWRLEWDHDHSACFACSGQTVSLHCTVIPQYPWRIVSRTPSIKWCGICNSLYTSFHIL